MGDAGGRHIHGQKTSVDRREPVPAGATLEGDTVADQARQLLDQWRGRLLARELDVLPHFLEADITNARLLCHQLTMRKTNGKTNVEIFVWKQLDEATRMIIARAAQGKEPEAKVRVVLAGALNRIIDPAGTDSTKAGKAPTAVWEKARFAKVRLSPEAKSLLAGNPRPGSMGMVRLQRFLLADAFPRALRRVPQDPSRFIPYGDLFPSQTELDQFDAHLQGLAAKAGLKAVTAGALARIDTRNPAVRLLETLRLVIERLGRVPENPRLQVVASVQPSSADAKRAVYEALARLRDCGMALDSNWPHGGDLAELLSPGASAGLLDVLNSLRSGLAKVKLSKGAQHSLTRLFNHAVFTDLFARSALWDRDHAEIRPFCQWLRRHYLRDVPGFVRHLLSRDEAFLHRFTSLHWEPLPKPKNVVQQQVWRQKRRQREQKQWQRIVAARASGQKPARRRRPVALPDMADAAHAGLDWMLVV